MTIYSCRCQLPFEEANASYNLAPDVWNMSIPFDSFLKTYSSCQRYDANFTEEYFQLDQPATRTIPCSKWVYDLSKYESSAIMEVRHFFKLCYFFFQTEVFFKQDNRISVKVTTHLSSILIIYFAS